MMKRFMAFLLSIVMVVTMMPVQTFAQEDVTEETVIVPEETQEENPVAEETAPEEIPATEEPVPEEIPVSETQEETVPETEQETQVVEETEPAFEAQIQPRSTSGDCSAEDSWNQTNDVSWFLDDSGTLTISGTGKMKDYSQNSAAPWFSERLNIKKVVVESGVTYVGDYAFYYCVNLTDVAIKDTVTGIGDYAFSMCTALTQITIPNSVKTLYNSVFSGCLALKDVTVLGETLTSVGSSAFHGCSSLPGVPLPDSVTGIGSYAFQNCTALKTMDLPDGITVVSSSLFSNCTALETVQIPDSVKEIGSYTFDGCTNLKNPTIPAGVTSIGYYAFRNCTSLTEMKLPAGLSNISQSCFSGCTGLTEIEIPKGVARIYQEAFEGCTNLAKVTMHVGLVTIDSYAFSGCSSMTSADIPDGTFTLGAGAFAGCTSLVTATIPDTVTSMGGSVFSGCTSLPSVKLPTGITTLGGSTFSGCTSLTNVTWPENLKTIGSNAFQNCTSMAQIEIPDSVTSVGNYAFDGCTSLASVTLSENLETIEYYAFRNCDSLTEVTLPEGLETIERYTFTGCDNLTKVYIPVSVTYIDEYAFSSCKKLTDITFAHTATDTLSIHDYAFYISTYSYEKDVPTTVSVPYARNIHSAIQDYQWDYYGREVTFKSYASLPIETILIDDTHPAQVEAGLEVAFTATVDPWYATSDVIWEVENTQGEAVIDEKGVLIGTKPGWVTVICKSSDNAAVCDETQIQILKATATVSSITIRCDGDLEAEIELGDKVQMIADVKPGNAMNKEVSWEVENGTGTATITEDGILTGLTCGTVTVFAMAQDGSEVIGSRVVEIMRYVTGITLLLNGREDFYQLGVDESAKFTAIFTPEDANYPSGKVTIENDTGEATYSDGYLKGVKAGKVTITVTADDNRKFPVSREIYIVGEQASYAVAGGNLYYNTVTGTITGCDNTVTSANIPAIINGTKITAIAPNAFYYQDNLTSVTIPSSVVTIGEYAFYRCDNISSLRFNGSGLKIIGDYAFYSCDALVNLTIPAGVETIGYEAFYDCDGLVNLTIPEGIKSIGREAFYSLSSLKNLTIPGDYDTRNWLSNNTLDTVTFTGTRIHEAILTQYESGGYNISRLPGREAKKVIITDTVTEIGEYAFHYCDEMTEVVIGNGMKVIGNNAFEECYSLTKVVLPEGIESLGERAFSRCNNLESINLPDSLKSIGRYCFGGDGGNKLQLIDLSGNPTKMSSQEMKLTYSMHPALAKASGSKSQIYWDLVYTYEDDMAGKPNPHDIARIDGKSGVLRSHGTGVGEVTVCCWDEYTGACGYWTIEIESGIQIRTDREENYLISGDVMQLTAWIMPGNYKTSVEWTVREEDREFASINQNGKLVAKAVTATRQIQVIAYPYDGGEPATLTVWIMPRTSGLYIYEGNGDVTGQTLDIDSSLYPSIQLSAVATPEGASNDVTWKTSDEDIASVDNGLVVFNGLGTVTISAYAADGSGKSASVKLNVTFMDSAKKLTATVDAEDNMLRCGDKTQMRVYGADPEVPLDPATLEFGIPDSQLSIATVDADGLITAGDKAGTVTVTASLKGDPLGRRVNLKITVKARLTEKLILHADAEEPAQVQMLDESGNVVTNPSAAVSYAVLLKKTDVMEENFTFRITPEAFNSAGSFQPEKTDLKWASSDTKLATVTIEKDGTALITVKKGMMGACVISAVTTDGSDVENRLALNVRDYSPRVESLKPVLNTYKTDSAVLSLVPSYDNWITGVALLEGGVRSQRLVPTYEDGVLTISAVESIPNSNLPLTLEVTCVDGETYSFQLAAKVKNEAPAVTLKQQDKLNLFYSDSAVALSVTAKNAVVTDVDLADTDDFTIVEYDRDTALADLRFHDDFDFSRKADTKATLLVYLEGYEQPIKKSITIATATKKPTVQLTASSSIINTAISTDHTTSFGFVIKGSDELLDLHNADVDVTASFAESWTRGDNVVLSLTGTKGGTATVLLQLSNWTQPVKLTHKITVETKKPALKFNTATLKVNNIFTDAEVSTTAKLTHSNLEIGSISFEPAAKEGTAARLEAEKLTVSYDPDTGFVVAQILDSENVPKTGSYNFNAYATLLDGTVLNASTLKITVEATTPKVKFQSATLKLNKVLAGDEIASTAVTLDKGEGYTLVDLLMPESNDVPVELVYADGVLSAKLLDADAANKTHTVKLTPVLRHDATGQVVELPTTVNLKVQIYSNASISVALSSKGKLDAVDPNSEICYTVKKITNACGSVTGVSLDGPDADLFEACLNEDGTVSLKLLPGQEYAIKKTYKVQFIFTICGRDVPSASISFKVSQSALKLAMTPATSTLYQSQMVPMTAKLTLTNPEGAALESVVLADKSSQAFLDAMGAGEMDVTISEDGRTATLEFDVRNASSLASGKSYVLYLDVTAQGSAVDAKPTQVKLTVKVNK